jgi:biotin-dependent carboxylase-like uncharacterized protein
MTISPPPSKALFRVIHAGAMTGLQDGGRAGLKAHGIPRGGAMDLVALERVNRLFDQDPHTAAWEMLWGGVVLECIHECWIAYNGDAQGWVDHRAVDAERTVRVHRGEKLRFVPQGKSLWTYLATPNGWYGPQWFGSQSVWPDGGMGKYMCDGDFLHSSSHSEWSPIAGVAARLLRPISREESSPFHVSIGPQWNAFPESAQELFLQSAWNISPQSNRAGFRLQGPVLQVPSQELISEPTLLGSIQVPANGQPIVLLNDGPTIGGYSKIAVIHTNDLDRFRQLPPGSSVHFSFSS